MDIQTAKRLMEMPKEERQELLERHWTNDEITKLEALAEHLNENSAQTFKGENMDKDEKYCKYCENFYRMSNQTMSDYHNSMACRPDYFEPGIKDSYKNNIGRSRK